MATFPMLSLYSTWVEETVDSMSLDQKIGQLLHPCIQPSAPVEERKQVLGNIEPGGIFLFSGTREEFQQSTNWFQAHASVPMIVSSDLENGAGRMILDATTFPATMAVGAANSETLAYEMGRAAAVEGRSVGVHWAFAPVVDVNLNPYNPGTNTISLGDDPARISRLANATIRGMQDHGLCATAKHFPGGGIDNRDQHICNTINSLPMDQWLRLSGYTFQQAINQGVWSIMIGHISLPTWDLGDGDHIQMAPPATLSRRILVDLLRERMGFQGVIITDAMDMAGVTSFGTQEEIVPTAIAAGCDMILFSNAQEDFSALKKWVLEGRLSVDRIEMSARRILALKEALGLNKVLEAPPLKLEEREHFRQVSREIAAQAVTLVRDKNQTVPLQLEKGSRVLGYHFRADPADNVDYFDDMLRQQGIDVIRYDEAEVGALHKRNEFEEFDALIINGVIGASWGTNRIRPAGNFMRDVWALLGSQHPRLILVSYGSPYLTYDFPHVPCIINAYSPDLNMQEAVLQVLMGELQPTATSPVNLEAPFLFKSLAGYQKLFGGG